MRADLRASGYDPAKHFACRNCGKVVRAAGRPYCDKRCYNAAKPPSVRQWTRSAFFPCLQCGQPARRSLPRPERVFCSNTCSSRWHSGPNHHQWIDGRSARLDRGPLWKKNRLIVLERDGYRCRRCGRSAEESGNWLVVDHFVPLRVALDPDESHDPSNLLTLCLTCHLEKTHGAERRFIRDGDFVGLVEWWLDTFPLPNEISYRSLVVAGA